MKSVIILRGVSGSGKSSFANAISDESTVVCCADDFFVDENGVYNFDVSKLGEAHAGCQNVFFRACQMDIPKIVVANTNTTKKEFKYYEDVGKSFRYQIFHVVVENRHGSDSIHNVPDHVLDNQRKRMLSSIQL